MIYRFPRNASKPGATFAGFGLSKQRIDRDSEENADQLRFGRSGALGLCRRSRGTSVVIHANTLLFPVGSLRAYKSVPSKGANESESHLR